MLLVLMFDEVEIVHAPCCAHDIAAVVIDTDDMIGIDICCNCSRLLVVMFCCG